MTSKSEGRKVKSIEQAGDILEYLRMEGPATIADLESVVPLSAGSIHTYLATLKDYGFIEQEGTKYRIGSMFIPYGVRVRNSTELYSASKDIIEAVAHEVGGCVHLQKEYNNRLLILEEVYGENTAGLDLHIKKRGNLQNHIHCTAGGKSILAQLPEPKVHQILDDHGLPTQTSQTITDREQLLDELKLVRKQGYAVNDQEHMHGIRAVGAPICRDNNGEVLGAISISGSAATWTGQIFNEKIPNKVKEISNEIEINIHSKDRNE
ncbi:IclR family transcriptional regulator [Halostagnicola kamekurae]|uniref:DNA-binding transcriptional regulator, IclR family n=1 Tax=Halostagnicola kamekurae TaxID=619731 RepID=A0A1I6TRP3_9EURY|nr:IclR family transcriptional regulator [Halostagnicola kamekurae]SFS91830.1 DNA-binding transcriptional regulator, IclR family [Halostagnicola kamekurae]